MSRLVMDGGHIVAEITAHPLSHVEASAICDTLHAAGIDVAVRLGGGVAHVTALAELTTAQECTALAAFLGVSDTRVIWHQAGAA